MASGNQKLFTRTKTGSIRFRIAVFLMLSAPLLVVIALWIGGFFSTPPMAFADFLTQIRSFHPFTYTQTVQHGSDTSVERISYRNILQRRHEKSDGTVYIYDLGSRPIQTMTLMPKEKCAIPQTLSTPLHDPNLLVLLAAMQPGKEKSLGVRTIDGHMAKGFQLSQPGGNWTIWADSATRQPVRIELDQTAMARTITMSNFIWNEDFDPVAFDTTSAPPGYTLQKPQVANTNAAPRQAPTPQVARNVQLHPWQPYSYRQTVSAPSGTSFTQRISYLALTRRRTERVSDNSILIQDYSGTDLKMLMLDTKRRLASVNVIPGKGPASDPNLFGMLRDMQDSREKDLGTSTVAGHAVRGFKAVSNGKIYTVWLDRQTDLPVRIEQDDPNQKTKIVMDDFQFTGKMDEALFSANPPEGYKVTKD